MKSFNTKDIKYIGKEEHYLTAIIDIDYRIELQLKKSKIIKSEIIKTIGMIKEDMRLLIKGEGNEEKN